MNSNFQDDYHYKFKITILGEPKSGKSTFIESISYKIINLIAITQNNGKTIDIESSDEISQRNVLYMHQQILYNINFSEIPCKDRTMPYILNYSLGSSVAIVLFDYNKVNSFSRAEQIFESIEPCKIPINILIGNKVDLLSKSKGEFVNDRDIDGLVEKYNLTFYKCNSNLENNLTPVLNKVMSDIQSYIGGNMELQNLIGKNLSVGKRIFNHPNFLKNLQENSYFKN